MAIRGLAASVLICLATSLAQADTIIKLSLGEVGPDIGMNSSGVLSTVDDGNAATTGNQNTAVEFTGFLDPLPDINTKTASFTLSNLVAIGPANVLGTLVVQNFVGGLFSLYDPANVLLLQGTTTNSSLTGTIGPPGTGSLFTTTIATVTGGTLAPMILPGSLSLSMDMTNVNGGAGFNVTGSALAPFLADASLNMAANPAPVPEPASLTLFALGSAAAISFRRRRRPSGIKAA
jgi:hypothetical protein